MVIFAKGHGFIGRIFHAFIKLNPTMLLYSIRPNRTMFYKAVKIYAVIYFFGLFRKPYVKAHILSQQEAEQQVQEEQVSSLLSKIDIKLADYPQSYFIIISSYYNHENDEELLEKQKTLFELNKLINKKLEINQQYYQDIKFLFIGDEEIYKIIQVGNTLVEFYPKERQRKPGSVIYIMNRQKGGDEKLLTTLFFSADLKSMLNVISKHKARRFAESMQF